MNVAHVGPWLHTLLILERTCVDLWHTPYPFDLTGSRLQTLVCDCHHERHDYCGIIAITVVTWSKPYKCFQSVNCIIQMSVADMAPSMEYGVWMYLTQQIATGVQCLGEFTKLGNINNVSIIHYK